LGLSALRRAAFDGHIDVVRLLLCKSATQQHKDGALATAVSRGQVAIIELLIAHGARVDQLDDNGQTPLHMAAVYNYGAAVQALLKAGSRVDCVNAGGDTPLMEAANTGNAGMVKLLAKKADVNLANLHGDTALMLAARGGYFEIVQRLLVKGAQAGKCNALGESALTAAKAKGHRKVAEFLSLLPKSAMAGTMPASSAHAMGEIHLMQAAAAGDLGRAQELLEAGVNVNAADKGRWTPLFIAAHQGHVAVLRLLMSHGADIDRLNRNGETALMVAAAAGQFASLQVLLVAGADAQRCNRQGMTASDVARDTGNELLASAFDSIVAQARAASSTRNTTAGTTTASTSTSSTSMPGAAAPRAVSSGKFVPRPGPTMLLQAIERNDANALTRLLTELRQSGNNLADVMSQVGALDSRNDSWLQDKRLTPLMAAAYLGHVPLLKLLLMHGADVDQVDFFGHTALIWAARSGHSEVVQALVEAGANIEHSYLCETALATAAAHGRTATVKVLLRSGACADPINHRGLSPLMSASQNGVTAIVEALLEYGADVNRVLNRRTALMVAKRHGHIDTVQVLLSAGADENLGTMQD
jgi:serine/threonine-protein phosphatase 6 regulatory ankyrin repeat subunit B